MTNADAAFDDVVFKVNASYDLSDDTMVYATWFEGFRHGGANGFPTGGTFAVTQTPIPYEADKTTNYEIGVKGYLLDDRVRYSAAAYRMDWKNVQLDTFVGFGVPAAINGDKARSKGIELEVTARFSDNFTGNFGWSHTDSELKGDGIAIEGFGGGFTTANAGDPMPNVPEHQLSLALNYFQPLSGGAELHYYVNGSYTDKIFTSYNSDFTANFSELDSYWLWNAGIDWNTDKWTVGLYGKNLGNEEALNSVAISWSSFADFGRITRPRTFVLKVTFTN